MTQASEQNAPALRFPEFSGEWTKRKLGEVAKIERGRFSPRPRNDPKYYGGEYPFVQTSDVVKSKGRISKYSQTLNDLGLGVSKFFPKGSLLITIAANIGYAGVLELDMACPDSLIGLTCSKILNNYFLNYILEIEQPKMDYLAVEAAQKNINIEFLRPYEIAFPPFPEQQKIASFLSSVDNKIEQLGKKKSLLEQYKKGMMQKLFSQELRFKNAQGNDFPDWEEKPLGGVFCEVVTKVGKRDIDTYSISAGSGFVSQKEKFGRDISGHQNSKYTVLSNGQFSYNKGNSKTYKYGCVYLNETGAQIAVPNVFISFELINSEMVAVFFAKLFEHHFLDKGLRQIISSSARMDGLLNVNKKFFFKLKILVPSPLEQQKIADSIAAIDRKINFASTELDQAKTFKKGLLQQMFV